MRKLNVLFLCTGNSCRSQMAEGWARALKSAELEPFSAGIVAHGLNPLAVRVMRECGVDLTSQTSDRLEDLGDLAGYAPGRTRSSRFGLKWLRLDRDLEEGMAVTIEPGFYWIPELLEDPERREAFRNQVAWERVEEFREVRGIRLERDYLVTGEGSELLTPGLPDEPEALEAAVGGQP